LPDNIKKEFDRCLVIHGEVSKLVQEMDARKDLAWSQIKLMIGPGYEQLEYDPDTQIIMGIPDAAPEIQKEKPR